MALGHPLLGLASMLFLAGSIVLMFFVILSSLSPTSPLTNTYFLRASTDGITGSRSISQWTYFFVCGEGNTDCGPPYPALPFGYAWSGNAANVPAELIGSHGGDTTSTYYFYMWRFGWVLYLMGLFFAVMAFLTSFMACCGRLGAAISTLIASAGLFFFTIAVALMTATFVKARDVFRANGREAEIGTYAFGFSWGAWAAMLIAVLCLFVGTFHGRNEGRSSRRFGRRSKSVRSTRSYDAGSIGGVGRRRVKDEYA